MDKYVARPGGVLQRVVREVSGLADNLLDDDLPPADTSGAFSPDDDVDAESHDRSAPSDPSASMMLEAAVRGLEQRFDADAVAAAYPRDWDTD
jgi:hypothetical protein